MSTPTTTKDAPKHAAKPAQLQVPPAANGETDEWQYVHKDEAALKTYMAGANAGKKVPFRGYKITTKAVPAGTHYVMSYSGREAAGQLATTLGFEAEAIDAPARVVSVKDSVDADPTLSEETRAAIKRLLASKS